MNASSEFFAARDALLARHNDDLGPDGFQWPRMTRFNWTQLQPDDSAEHLWAVFPCDERAAGQLAVQHRGGEVERDGGGTCRVREVG